MKGAITGYGSILWILSNMITTTSFFIIAFVDQKNKAAGYTAVLLLPISQVSIDLISKFTLARYSANKPTYYANTWYNTWTNLSIAIGLLAMTLFDKKVPTMGEFDHAMIFFGSTSAAALLVATGLLVIVRKNNNVLEDLRI